MRTTVKMAEDMEVDSCREQDKDGPKPERMFTLKKWNLVAMWSWDVECDTCAICRVQVMGNLTVFSLKHFSSPLRFYTFY